MEDVLSAYHVIDIPEMKNIKSVVFIGDVQSLDLQYSKLKNLTPRSNRLEIA